MERVRPVASTIRERPGAVLDGAEDRDAPVEYADAAGREVPAEVLRLAQAPGPHQLAVADVALESGSVLLLLVVSPCYHPVPLYGLSSTMWNCT